MQTKLRLYAFLFTPVSCFFLSLQKMRFFNLTSLEKFCANVEYRNADICALRYTQLRHLDVYTFRLKTLFFQSLKALYEDYVKKNSFKVLPSSVIRH